MPTFAPSAASASARLTAVEDLPTPPLPELTAIMFFTPLMPGWFFTRFSVAMLCDSFQSMAFAPVTRSNSALVCSFNSSKALCQTNGICSSMCTVSSSQATWCSAFSVVKLCFRVGCWKFASVPATIARRRSGDLAWDSAFIPTPLLFSIAFSTPKSTTATVKHVWRTHYPFGNIKTPFYKQKK